MEEAKEALKKISKKISKHFVKAVLPVILVATVVMIFLAAITYYVFVWIDGIFRDEDWSSVPYAASQYTNNVIINDDGSVSSNMTAQELWDKMYENNSRITEYLDNPEELERLMNAELATSIPDTGSNNGVIKFIRKDYDGTGSKYLTYLNYNDFMEKVNNGDQDVFNYFTLKQTVTTVKSDDSDTDTNSNNTVNSSTSNTNKSNTSNASKSNTSTNSNSNTNTSSIKSGWDNSLSGDGYTRSYVSSGGITFKEYKQGSGSYCTNSYWNGTIASSGCGPTSVAILASGMIDSAITPAETAAQMKSNGNYTFSDKLAEEMESLGMTGVEIISNESAQDIIDALHNGKVMVVSVGAATGFTSASHIMAVVDIDENNNVFVLNPSSSKESGWYPASDLISGNGHPDYIVTADAQVRSSIWL